MVAPLTSKAPALISLMEHYDWRKAVILTSINDPFLESGIGLQKKLRDANMEILKPAPFESGDFQAATLGEVQRSGLRIVILMAFDDDILAVTSSAAGEGMVQTAGWVWLLMDSIAADMIPAMQGWLVILPLAPSKGMQTFAEQVSNYTKSHFGERIDEIVRPINDAAALCRDRTDRSKYNSTCAETANFCEKVGIGWIAPDQANKEACPVTCGGCPAPITVSITADSVDVRYSAALYDSVVLYARAATKVLAEGGDLHDAQAVTAAMRNTTVEGVGGVALRLDNHGDRIESYEVMNCIVGADSDFRNSGGVWLVPVGEYSTELQLYTEKRTAVWPGPTTEVPIDSGSHLHIIAGTQKTGCLC